MAKQIHHSPIKDLIRLLTDTKRNVYCRQLHDGKCYVYTNDGLMASFRWYGGFRLYDLRLNTKRYIDKPLYNIMRLDDRVYRGCSILLPLLHTHFPYAKTCNNDYKHGLEWSIIEAALLDSTTCIEIEQVRYGLTVAMVNMNHYISCSFKYLPANGRLVRVFIRFNGKEKDIRVIDMRVPPYGIELIEGLMTRELLPIVD